MGNKPVRLYSVPYSSHLRRQEGFVPLKVVVVIAILGTLIGSALPAYKVYEQRAYASEASLVLTRILDSQSAHFRRHDRYYPDDGQAMSIFHGDPSSQRDLEVLENALDINISGDDLFDYHIQTFPDTGDDFCVVMVSAPFPLFTDGTSHLLGLLDKDGSLLVSSDPRLTGSTQVTKNQKNAKNNVGIQ